MGNKSNLVRYLEDKLNEPGFESLSPKLGFKEITGPMGGGAVVAAVGITAGILFAAYLAYDYLKFKYCPEQYLADQRRLERDLNRPRDDLSVRFR